MIVQFGTAIDLRAALERLGVHLGDHELGARVHPERARVVDADRSRPRPPAAPTSWRPAPARAERDVDALERLVVSTPTVCSSPRNVRRVPAVRSRGERARARRAGTPAPRGCGAWSGRPRRWLRRRRPASVMVPASPGLAEPPGSSMSRNTHALVPKPPRTSFSVIRQPMSSRTVTTSRIRKLSPPSASTDDVPLQRVDAVERGLARGAGREADLLVPLADERGPVIERRRRSPGRPPPRRPSPTRRRRELIERDVGAELRRPRLPPVGHQHAVAEVLGLEVRAAARVGPEQQNAPTPSHGAHDDPDHDERPPLRRRLRRLEARSAGARRVGARQQG